LLSAVSPRVNVWVLGHTVLCCSLLPPLFGFGFLNLLQETYFAEQAFTLPPLVSAASLNDRPGTLLLDIAGDGSVRVQPAILLSTRARVLDPASPAAPYRDQPHELRAVIKVD